MASSAVRALGKAARRGSAARVHANNGNTSQVLSELRARGLFDATTGEAALERALTESAQSVYCGFDPTADSLHLGHLPSVIALEIFRRSGHTPIALIGGATGRVGDPSGKSAERPLLSGHEVDANANCIGEQLKGMLGSDVDVRNNMEWFGGMGFVEFLRDVGKYARVGSMLAKDSVKSRIGSESEGMSFTEFSYQLLQAFDFLQLLRRAGTRVQLGGSDQWGNITAGTELIRKVKGETEVHGITFPLLERADGTKYGKSEGGAIWLSSSLMSPYGLYQRLFRTEDADVCRCLRSLTLLPVQEIDAYEEQLHIGSATPNEAQQRLAEEVVRFVHGESGLEQAKRATEVLKPGNDTPLDAELLESMTSEAPCTTLERSQVVGAGLADVLVACGMQPSKSAARRLISQGGARINNERLEEERALDESDLLGGRIALLTSGKKNKRIVRLDDSETQTDTIAEDEVQRERQPAYL